MSSECEFQPDSPLNYSVEEGEISSGAPSPSSAATVVESTTMDTAVQTSTRPQSPRPSERPPSERPPSGQEQKLKSLVNHVDNTYGQERYNSLSEKRKQIAAPAKQTHQQQVNYHPNHQPIANFSYQYNQIHASPIATPTTQQVYFTNPYNTDSQYPVYQPPATFNPPMPAPMPEPMPEPPTELNGTTPHH